MNKEAIPTKWSFIATWLEVLDAPKKVVNAATAIDDALENRGLKYNTQEWKTEYERVPIWNHTKLTELYRIIVDDNFCTACEDCKNKCHLCKLGEHKNCTPRSKHADKYYSIVRNWVRTRAYPELYELH